MSKRYEDLVHPDTYLYPCPNNGQCRRIMFLQLGINATGYFPPHGIKTAVKFHHGNVPDIKHYKCCTQCHLPINGNEAAKINAWLGYEPEKIIIDADFLEDADFMEKLNGFG